ncbi:hypothetical protein EDC01DRAFT_715774 [Geopyxis carbonaria]|nr:hypothetical protein EDC01DRAFT_715774 [Geopyxis carbonaria]
MKWNSLLTAACAVATTVAALNTGVADNDVDGLLAALNVTASSARTAAAKVSKETLACNILELAMPQVGYRAGDSSYEALRTGNWAQNAWLHPGCVVTPTDTRQVQIAVLVARVVGSRFAVRSGGHNPNAGWSNTDGGVLVDMAFINEVTVAADKKSAVVGTGRRWIEVYEALEPHGVVVVGGRVAPVGVGGLLLGGGLSYLSNEAGVAADNILAYELVTASGALTTASATQNRDLFWALKGGTSNFGIVTRFTLRTLPMGRVWGGYRVYAYTQAPAIVAAMAAYQASGEADRKSAVCAQLVPTNATLFVTFLHTAPSDAMPAAFAAFRDIPALVDTTRAQSWVAFHADAPGGSVPRWGFRTTTVKLDAALYAAALDIVDAESKALGNVQAGTLVYVLQPISRNVVQQGVDKGGNALGLAKTQQMWISLTTGWNLAADDATVHAIAKTIEAKISRAAKAAGKFLPYQFMSDAASDQDVLASYGAANHARLVRVARKYDPSGVFQKLQLGGFKLSPKAFVCPNF